MTKRKNGNKREAPISYRPAKDVREQVLTRMERSGLPKSVFITQAILGQDAKRSPRHPVADAKELVRLQARAASLTDALKAHETRLADDPEIRALIEASYAEITEIRTALLKALGRQT